MKILYISIKYNPLDPNGGSSLDYELFRVLQLISKNIEVLQYCDKNNYKIFASIKRLYRKITGKKLYKYGLIDSWILSREIENVLKSNQYDFVFTAYPNAMCFYKNKVPLILVTDTTFIGQQIQWPLYGTIGMQLSVWQELRAFKKGNRIITFSKWSKEILKKYYMIEAKKIDFFPIPAAIPEKFSKSTINTINVKTLKLLIVAREFYRKGVDIAIEVVKHLNAIGKETKLVICGLTGRNNSQIEFIGPFDKGNDLELKQYISTYKNAHLLIHPARFEAAGITPSEAAACGIPTITNDVGGLGTTVQHGVSGIVLPAKSDSSAYVREILKLIKNPYRYTKLCQNTRKRYEKELKWSSQIGNIKGILQSAKNYSGT